MGPAAAQAARGSAGPSDEELRALLRSQLVGGGGGSGQQQQQPLFGASSAPGRSQQQRNALWPELPPELAGYEGVFFGGGERGERFLGAVFDLGASVFEKQRAVSSSVVFRRGRARRPVRALPVRLLEPRDLAAAPAEAALP